MVPALLLVLVGVIVLFLTFGPILRRPDNRFVINPHALTTPTGRLLFRHPEQGDLGVLDALYGDPESVEANFWDADSVAATREMLHNNERFEPWAQMSLVGVDAASGLVVGLATLSTEDGPERQGLSIGLQMVPAHRGRGLATELLAAMISATRDLTEGEVWIGTSITNHPVRHMMDRLGYTAEPSGSPYAAPDGTLVESNWFRVGRGSTPPRFP